VSSCFCARWVWFLLAALAPRLAAGGPKPPEESARLFSLADPRLRVELAAAEPLLSSPVAMAWDEWGILYVAEMTDYPRSDIGGHIRRLVDVDGDGRYDRSSVFAGPLPYPNSVLPWNGGILVMAAPDLWYFKDADRDGVAEHKERVYSGFGTGNQQLRANGLTWGLDHWVYGANGRSDGLITWTNGSAPVSLRGRDFRFRPGHWESFETLAGRSQFGLGLDDWGNRFLSWNTIPLRHEVFPDRWIPARVTGVPLEVLADTMPLKDDGSVFPSAPAPRVFNNESSTHFNALSGLHLYRGDALGEEYAGDAFTGESLLNLVHRRRLTPQGASFVAERMEHGREFLSSRDPWFHPVNFATGPDGALYVADFYREFVEHPDWVSKELRTRTPWDTGKAHGRIWRVSRKDLALDRTPLRPWPGDSNPRHWVSLLEHPNGWLRDTAQRLIVERRAAGSSASLRLLLKGSGSARSAVHALHTLDGLGLLTPDDLLVASRSSHPRVREQSLQQGLRAERVLELMRDPDPRVRLRAILQSQRVSESDEKEKAIADAVAMADSDRWILVAAALATSRSPVPWLDRVKQPALSRPAPSPRGADPDREQVVKRFMPALALEGKPGHGLELARNLCFPCHVWRGQGRRVGPDLTSLASKSPEALLVDILDPSRQVTPDAQSYEVVMTNGETVAGLIASESDTRITLRHGGGPDISVARAWVVSMRASGRSLMPEGLEAGLTIQDFADLLGFLLRAESLP